MRAMCFRRITACTGLLALLMVNGMGKSQAISLAKAQPDPFSALPIDSDFTALLPLLLHDECTNFTASVIVPRPPHFPRSVLKGSFTYPKHCRTGLMAGSPIPVSGVATHVPEGAYLWVFVYAANQKYYPQCNNALEGLCGVDYSNGEWHVTVYMGRAGFKEHFHLALVEVDRIANDFLTDKMKDWAESGFFPGLAASELDPYVIKEVRSIQVETAGR